MPAPKMSQAEAVKTLYRFASLAAHPDRRGGDTADMVRVNLAYETLKASALANPNPSVKKPPTRRKASGVCMDCGGYAKPPYLRCWDCQNALAVCPECGVRKYDSGKYEMCWLCAN